MKKSYQPLAYFFLLMLIFVLLPALIHAQPGGPGGDGPPNPDCPPDIICPIDGGLTALIAIGIGYGIKKIGYHKRTKSIS